MKLIMWIKISTLGDLSKANYVTNPFELFMLPTPIQNESICSSVLSTLYDSVSSKLPFPI